MKNHGLIIIFLLFPSFLPALQVSQKNSFKGKAEAIRGDSLRILRKKMLLNYPGFPVSFNQLNGTLSERALPETGDTLKFFTIEYKNGQFFRYDTVSAILKRQGKTCNVWVEISELNNSHVTETVMDEFLVFIDSATGKNSKNPELGLIELEREYFGDIVDTDSSGRVDFLIFDIKDEYESVSNGETFQAGYFSEVDQGDTLYSNEKDLIYLDSYPTLQSGGADELCKTAAQVLQMFIHYYYDSGEYVFLNMGTSLYALTVSGYGILDPEQFFGTTDKNLTIHWDNADFAKSQLFVLYLAEQLGDLFIRNLIADTLHGIESIESVLSRMGLNITFEELFCNWAVANYMNNVSVDSRYGYILEEAQEIKAEAAYNHFLYPAYRKEENIGVYPLGKGWSFEYSRFTSGDTLTLNYLPGYRGFPVKAILMEFGDNYRNVRELPLSEDFVIEEFGSTIDEVVVAAVNYHPYSTSYSYSADIKTSRDYVQVKLDDGKPAKVRYGGKEVDALNWGVHHTNFGWGVMFEDYDDNLTLAAVRIYMASVSDTLWFNIWLDNNADGIPESRLFYSHLTVIPPITTGEWVDIDLTEYESQLRYLYAGRYFYPGVLHANEEGNTYFAIDSNSINYSHSFARGLNAGVFRWGSFNSTYLGAERVPLRSYNLMFRAAFKVNNGTGITIDETAKKTVTSFILYQNYPNPFNPSTRIRYELPKAAYVSIVIYNSRGQQVRTLVRENKPAGYHEVRWDGRNESGVPVSSGVYVYRIHAGNVTDVKKMVLLR